MSVAGNRFLVDHERTTNLKLEEWLTHNGIWELYDFSNLSATESNLNSYQSEFSGKRALLNNCLEQKHKRICHD